MMIISCIHTYIRTYVHTSSSLTSTNPITQAIDRFGHVDVWINNAGRGISKSILDVTDDDFDEMMLVNTKSALYRYVDR